MRIFPSALFFPVLSSLLAACGPDVAQGLDQGALDMSASDMSMNEDIGEQDMRDEGGDALDAGMDGGQEVEDTGLDSSPDEDAAQDMDEGGLPSTCEGECAMQTLMITQGAKTRPLIRAVYGISTPEQSIHGDWELYIEALTGGYEGCPEETSPTPDYSLLLTGWSIPSEENPTATQEDEVRAILFDYVGDLVPEPPFRTSATTLEVTARALSVCKECVEANDGEEESDPDGFIALTLSSSYEGGTIEGTIYATHCDSLDAK